MEGVSAGGGRREPGGDAEGSESSPEVYLEHAADITWQSQRAIPAAGGLVLNTEGLGGTGPKLSRVFSQEPGPSSESGWEAKEWLLLARGAGGHGVGASFTGHRAAIAR